MSVKKTAGAYSDCQLVMDKALEEGLITIDFDTYGQASVFRQRCHSFRKRLHDASRPAPGALPSTPYDTLQFSLPKKGTQDDSTLTIRSIEEQGLQLLSRIRTAEGKPLEAPHASPEDALADLRKNLGLE